jgi:hypothetical protein
MTDHHDLFAWADSRPKPEAVILDALPRLLAKIRIEQAFNIPRPTGGAKVLPLQRKAA